MRTYTIDGCNEMFLTLQEAKKHIWLAYTPKECIKELTDTCIVGWKDGEVHSLTAIRVITEREVLLLKKRANNGDNEAANFYPGCDTEIEVTEEQSAKGFAWLMNLYKTPTGKERKNNPFGYREMNILDNYKGERFQFVGFYNDGNRWHENGLIGMLYLFVGHIKAKYIFLVYN